MNRYKNIFILNTGRCGSNTFFEACKHIKNYTCGHETRTQEINKRLFYPAHHIEVDNRLSWFLGTLGKIYPRAFFVHLIRNRDDTVKSFMKRRGQNNINRYWCEAVLNTKIDNIDEDTWQRVCESYYDHVNNNIRSFIGNRSSMIIELEHAKGQFPIFCQMISAEVDMDKAINEFDVKYNASGGSIRN